MKPLKSGRAKTYSRPPLASKSGGAFALPALQLVPPLLFALTARYTFLVVTHPGCPDKRAVRQSATDVEQLLSLSPENVIVHTF